MKKTLQNDVPAAGSSDRLEFLDAKFKLAQDIDAVLEQCFTEQKDLSAAMDVVFKCLKRHLNPIAAFLRTFNEDLNMTVFPYGILEELLVQSIPDLLKVAKPTVKETRLLRWFAIPLDMSGETVGTFGIAFPGKPSLPDDQIFELMDIAAEELDNYFYTIQTNRKKHAFMMEMQDSLRSRNLPNALEEALASLCRITPMYAILLAYIDDLPGFQLVKLNYIMFVRNQKLFDSSCARNDRLDLITIRSGSETEWNSLPFEMLLDDERPCEKILLQGTTQQIFIGCVVAVPLEGNVFSISAKEMLQVFSSSVRQRLVDFNREKNLLRRFFDPRTTNRLLAIKEYQEKYLFPQTRKIGLLMADIFGFSRFCEEILQSPDFIARFLNEWSVGVTGIIFNEGGAIDKMVGDSIIALFGPPFYEYDESDITARMMRTALAVREFSISLLRRFITNNSSLSNKTGTYGITIGISLETTHIAMIGPNQSLTAIGRGVNEIIYMTNHGNRDEILVSQLVRQQAEKLQPSLWDFSNSLEISPGGGRPKLIAYKLRL